MSTQSKLLIDTEVMTPDPIRAALQRLVEALNDYDPQWDVFPEDAITAARAALAAAPEGEPSDEELRDLWSWSSGQDQGPWPTQYHCFARAVLARWGPPAARSAPPEGEPSDQEIGDFIAYWWECFGKGYLPHSSDAPLVKAALARWGRPAAPPAPLEGEVGE